MSKERVLKSYDYDLFTLRRVRKLIEAHMNIARRAGESASRQYAIAVDVDNWIGEQKRLHRIRKRRASR
jgi:hypothetical protein